MTVSIEQGQMDPLPEGPDAGSSEEREKFYSMKISNASGYLCHIFSEAQVRSVGVKGVIHVVQHLVSYY